MADQLTDQEREAARRLSVFAGTPGDYILPLLAAYSDDGGSETYEGAVAKMRADMRLVLTALARHDRRD